MDPNLFFQTITSHLGDINIAASDLGIRWVKLNSEHKNDNHPNHHTEKAASQLTQYFEGKRTTFDLAFDLDGYTEFSQKVWTELLNIPYGETISYKELAIRLGDVKCIRAAGTANGRNPIPIIIPCHRVIGSDSNLTGYALGLDIKKALLTLENPQKYRQVQGSFPF